MTAEEELENAARDGSLDIAQWPVVLETILQRLHDIVHSEFPIPSLPPPVQITTLPDSGVIASTPPPSEPPVLHPTQTSSAGIENEPHSSSMKENEEPPSSNTHPAAVLGFEVNRAQLAVQPPQSIDVPPGSIPPDLLSMYQTSARVLENDFAKSPPYTVQRLAEMVLRPKKHYRYLPAYLRALDRVISVSSPVSDFPLPSLNASINGSGFLTNGEAPQTNGQVERGGLGSDESLGGALLTPIPWLRNATHPMSSADGELRSESTETIEGPNGTGSIETVSVTLNGIQSSSAGAHTSPNQPSSPTLSEQSDASTSTSGSDSAEAHLRQQGAVTQGELLRQEQEAGVILTNPAAPFRSMMAGGAVAVGREPSEYIRKDDAPEPGEDEIRPADEVPHARGPDEIGLEDLGPQHHNPTNGLDIEAAVGRARSPPVAPPAAAASGGSPSVAATLGGSDDEAGASGKDPKDVELEVQKLRDALVAEEADGVKRDSDRDVKM